jgi:four helix bundle protein
LVKETYMLLKSYRREELYGLISQTRRSAVSIPSNIAEGIGRNYKKIVYNFFTLQEDLFTN